MIGFSFAQYVPPEDNRSTFEKLLALFLEILTHTSGDVEEALDWMEEVDKAHGIFPEDYTIDDFRNDLFRNSMIRESTTGSGAEATAKTEKLLRNHALEQIFGRMKKGKPGGHRTRLPGPGADDEGGVRPYEFGDPVSRIDFSQSLRNAYRHSADDDFRLHQDDLEVREGYYQSMSSTVIMIDISHSMILYGEDRITPAKKVALALAEYIRRKYPKDSLDFVVFGNDAWEVQLKDLPYLQVGPFHTNTVAGLQLAMDILRRRKNPNRQIFMITDGKPTCLKERDGYYKNSSYGHDPRIISKCIQLATQCRKLDIPITTFMIAQDPYLQSFVDQFTEANKGKAFFSSLDGLGELIFKDYEQNKRKRHI